jgi:hypothetical protein
VEKIHLPENVQESGECMSFVESNRGLLFTALPAMGSLRRALREPSDGNKIDITARGTITLTSGELAVGTGTARVRFLAGPG